MQNSQADRACSKTPCGTEAVSILAVHGEWHVVIVENGIERVQPFVQRDWAISYASGQSLRLGLPAAPRLADA